jgi:hypothetical protein
MDLIYVILISVVFLLSLLFGSGGLQARKASARAICLRERLCRKGPFFAQLLVSRGALRGLALITMATGWGAWCALS